MIVLLALTLAAAARQPTVAVSLLESQHLDHIRVGHTEIIAAEEGVVVQGIPRDSFQTGPGRWRVEARSLRRVYEGTLTITAARQRLKIVLRAPLESYVAGVVAAESDPDTPPAALQALAVVVRSYAEADRRAPLCDLASCQVFHGQVSGALGRSASDAAEATAGLVLWTGGRIAGAVFHASCGGRTADPLEVFGAPEQTGARPVSDLDDPDRWTARLPLSAWRRGLREAFGDPLLLEEPVLIRGAGDRVVQLALPDGRRAAADLLVRSLDRALGRGVIRSARFSVRHEAGGVLLNGSGHGHGVGLCQAGAALRADRGDSFEEILRAYFPAAAVGALPAAKRSTRAPDLKPRGLSGSQGSSPR